METTTTPKPVARIRNKLEVKETSFKIVDGFFISKRKSKPAAASKDTVTNYSGSSSEIVQSFMKTSPSPTTVSPIKNQFPSTTSGKVTVFTKTSEPSRNEEDSLSPSSPLDWFAEIPIQELCHNR